MDLKTLLDTPPWDWPEDAGKILGEILRDEQADASDRLVAAERASDLIVIHDELAETLLSIVRRGDPPEPLRARAALSLGPVLEQGETQGFEVPDQVPITPRAFRRITESLGSR
jgi:hypothetical protein